MAAGHIFIIPATQETEAEVHSQPEQFRVTLSQQERKERRERKKRGGEGEGKERKRKDGREGRETSV